MRRRCGLSNVAIGITGVGSCAFRAKKTEAALKGQKPTADVIKKACGTASDGIIALAAPRIATKNTHGTGCTLSSAIAAGLAKGLDLVAAVREAKAYVSAAIAAADRLTIGSGHGPVHHFHVWW